MQVLVAPSITKQPANLSVTVGAPATFSVEITGGTPPVTFQWKRNGDPIITAVDRSYTIPATEIGDNGATFAVDIVSPAGPLSSVPATLTVTAAGPGINLNVNTSDDRIDDDTSDGVCHTSANTCSLRAAVMQANRLTAPLVRINVPAGVYTLTRPPTGIDDESSGNLNIDVPPSGGCRHRHKRGRREQHDYRCQPDGQRDSNCEGPHRNSERHHRPQWQVAADSSGQRRRHLQPGRFDSYRLRDRRQSGGRYGGGIYSSGTLKVIRSTIRSNTGGFGGGLYLSGPATVRDSTIHGNHANGAAAAAFTAISPCMSSIAPYLRTLRTPMVEESTTASVGIPTAVLYNTTVTDNDADHDRDESGGIGGGVYQQKLARASSWSTA